MSTHRGKVRASFTTLERALDIRFLYEKQFWILFTLLINSPRYRVTTQKTVTDVIKTHGKNSWI